MKTPIVLLTAVLVSFISGCGKGIPDSASPEVRDLVLRIVHDEYRDMVSAICYRQISNVPTDMLGIKVNHAWLVRRSKEDDVAKKILDSVDAAMLQSSMTLNTIRIDKVDKEVKKVYCSAEVKVGEEIDQIKFTAQYTENGELYVEVSDIGMR